MHDDTHVQGRVVVLSPFGVPDAAPVVAACRAGALGVVDLGADPVAASSAVGEVARRWRGHFGVRAGSGAGPAEVEAAAGPGRVSAVIVAGADQVAAWMASGAWAGPAPQVLVEVNDAAGALEAMSVGACGVVVVGNEAAGRVGEATTFVALQDVVAALGTAGTDGPAVWVRGGIGPHTAAAAAVGGAAAVVVDAQVALCRDVTLPIPLRTALAAMDGSETVVVGGHRVFTRPDLPAASLASDSGPDEVAPLVGGTDLASRLVPVGQDGALARPLAAAHRTVGGVVQAIARSLEEGPALARRAAPLAPGSPLAGALGVRYPVAQGPMTRVSDSPAFAEAVADAGGLPFLALALLSGAEVRDLVAETAERLAGRPFGAGILGFVPAELREEQLRALLESPPPVALIAGGRPSQARPLEEAGCEVFLHVPSPGLLERFVADGARRFVFEGRECGGHVGPRTSFALWESQLQRLGEVADPADLNLLFAGGVHDARSAAMVAAMAAPLAARGAAVGVLMGTAYLFTDEAVASGAIEPGFRDMALAADATVLLETSPGHATRCVDTPYVQAFDAERRRLEEAGTTSQERWAALETLNLGRLRIASKGVRRAGDRLERVSADDQHAEGMYMMGQVAALRSTPTTIAELHRQVTEGATELLEAHTGRLPSPGAGAGSAVPDRDRGQRGTRVAIVGMAGVFAGADGTDAFWTNVVRGADLVTEVPAERWDVDRYYDPDAVTRGAGRRTPSKWGGFLPPVPFDALRFGIPPASLGSIEPVQLLSLEIAARALADAGYGDREFDREHVSVIFGAEAGTDLASAYGFRALYPQVLGPLPGALDEVLPSLTEDSFPGVLTNVIAGRIANRLDLGGVNYTVDAACAASLAAVDMACKELTAGTSDLVLCGGADLHNGVADYLLFAGVHALSPTGRCRSFDADADGIALGEGVACVVLKRLDDAERDGDRIYAVIEGIAGSSDGRSLGLTAPRPEGQRRALERAYARAGVPPSAVGLLEAHGTGTVVGDRTELATLEDVFGEAGSAPGSVALGSVKSQIGHTKCAAGMAGLMKAALAVHRGVRPPTVNLRTPNPAWDRASSPFTFSTSARPWPAPDRVAGVSAFGFGGTNFHAVVGSYEGDRLPDHGLDAWPAELFLVRGATDDDAVTVLARLTELVDAAAQDPSVRLRDLAATVASWGRGPVRLAIVATDVDDLRRALAATARGEGGDGIFRATGEGGAPGQVAFLYPGQGSQRPGMVADLFVAFPPLQRHLRAGARWADVMFPPAAFDAAARAAQQAALTDTAVAQPALGIGALAVTQLLGECGVVPDVLGGHSYGELVALAVAGALPEDELLALSEHRGQVMVAAAGDDPGCMAAAGASAAAVRSALADAGIDDVVVANDNGPGQVVISGTTPGVARAAEALDAARIAHRSIPVACAFHSPVVAGAAPAFAEILARLDVRPPDRPVYANVSAAPYPGDPAAVRSLLASQLASPVRFREQVEAMYDAGVRCFVEAGSGRVLTQLVGRILGDRPHLAVAVDVPGEPGVPQFLHALARLAVAGVPVRPERLFEGRARVVDAAALGRGPGWWVNGHLVRTADGAVVAGGLPPGPELSVGPLDPAGPLAVPGAVPAGTAGAVPGAVPGGRDAAMIAYLESMRSLVEAQRDVFLGYLGAPVPAPASPAAAVPAPVAPSLSIADPGARGASGALPGAGFQPAPAAVDRDGLERVLVGLVAERTGYPEDMLGPELDLEADLGIDSIKRLEIVGELVERLGMAGAGGVVDEQLVEQLVALKTLRAVSAWLADHAGDPGAAGAAAGADAGPGTAAQHGAGGSVPRGDALLALLLAAVAERTGYPEDMVGPELDLEADLGIDSIKRLEILGEVADRIGLSGGDGAADESVVEQLVACKTLRAVVDWIDGHVGAAAPSAPPAGAGAGVAPAGEAGPEVPARSVRGVLRAEPCPLTGAGAPSLSGATIAVVSEPGSAAAAAVAGRLGDLGAVVVPVAPGTEIGAVDGVVDLRFAGAGQATVPELFEEVAPAALSGLRWLVAVTSLGGTSGRGTVESVDPVALGGGEGTPMGPPPGSGVAGLFRSLARELPGTVVRALDVPLEASPDQIAGWVVEELGEGGGPAAVGRLSGQRVTVVAREEEVADGPSAPAVDDRSVVVLTGGARGITARLAVALAQRFGCSVELVGRAPVPDAPEDPEIAAAPDAPSLRRVLVERGWRTPAEIERECGRLLAAREIRSTLDALEDAGVKAGYHTADVRDPAAMAAVMADVRQRYGKIDGVVHGAGVIEDRLLADKRPDSFRRVFETKVAGAEAVLAALGGDRPFLVFFTSVSGAFGNRGQVDYAAANDALASLAWHLAGRWPSRVVAVDWGPWAGSGMVTPELEREYARRGVGLVDGEDGIDRLLDELARPAGEPEIVVARARLAAFAWPQGTGGHAGG